MNWTSIDLAILAPAFCAGVLVLATHVPLGAQVLRKGIVFIDLAIAQIAALGVIGAGLMDIDPSGWQVQVAAAAAALAGALLLAWTEKMWPEVQEAQIGVLFVLAATAGILLLAKKRSALVELHRMLREGEVKKVYVAVVKGVLDKTTLEIRAPLRKYVSAKGERRVSVGEGGREAVTRVKALKSGRDCSVLEVRLLTGRTHQIRVHLAHAGHPILGDDKYGDFSLNHALAKQGVRRLFLHARLLEFAHPISGEHVELEAKLPDDMRAFVEQP